MNGSELDKNYPTLPFESDKLRRTSSTTIGVSVDKVWVCKTISSISGPVLHRDSSSMIPRIMQWSCTHSLGLKSLEILTMEGYEEGPHDPTPQHVEHAPLRTHIENPYPPPHVKHPPAFALA
ncbi:hypothetical protein E5676_scaffold455G003170 [Cucumis melo var. makuwa]|uniref:Uncharacterized protein n=1 Tax=Cucumis melo var. makuwa TaxID=1194695 RepID=A0A5A7SZT9_CUCMM|nr:hypothetical protein E6C27_scaffold285G001130 [Cucumis melo var. makuwa]TYK31059.1 hypothetical protein E5676_scaffold455G003170 [Cucumis melo var. makuwa]